MKQAKRKFVVKSDDQSTNETNGEPDRVKFSLSLEVFDGCWVSAGLETSVRGNENLEQCSKRCAEYVETTVNDKAEELIKERESEND